MDRNLKLCPLDLPQMYGDHMGDKLKICNLEVSELIRNGTRKVFVVFVIVATKAGCSVFKSIGRGIQGDMDRGLGDEEGNAVSDSNCFLPPTDIVPEAFIEVNGLLELGGEPFGGETTVEK